jgi:hypothetical protein
MQIRKSIKTINSETEKRRGGQWRSSGSYDWKTKHSGKQEADLLA